MLVLGLHCSAAGRGGRARPVPDKVTETPSDMHPSKVYFACNPTVNVYRECEDVETHTREGQKNTCEGREVARRSSLGQQLSLSRHE